MRPRGVIYRVDLDRQTQMADWCAANLTARQWGIRELDPRAQDPTQSSAWEWSFDRAATRAVFCARWPWRDQITLVGFRPDLRDTITQQNHWALTEGLCLELTYVSVRHNNWTFVPDPREACLRDFLRVRYCDPGDLALWKLTWL